MTREPKVGDVHNYCWDSELYRRTLIEIVDVLQKTRPSGEVYYMVYIRGITSERIRGRREYDKEIRYSTYKGKLAPRYKRLFGIYFVKDTND